MEIRNFNETFVREEVQRMRRERRGPAVMCWCSLCESDVISLALTSLPPCYGRATSESRMKSRVSRPLVSEAVRRAVDRVSQRPKHPSGLANYLYYQVRVVNYPLETGALRIDEALDDASAACHCGTCRADALALALNRFPPLYGVDLDGRSNFPAERRRFLGREMNFALSSAARVVGANPHH